MLSLVRPFAAAAIITQEFGPTSNEAEPAYGAWAHFHRGVDYALAAGTTQFASGDGEVVAAGWDPAYGNTVVLSVGHGITVRVAHLNTILVAVGAQVAQGRPLGLTGSTGNSTGPHCHWEVCSYGAPVHPWCFLAATAPPAR